MGKAFNQRFKNPDSIKKNTDEFNYKIFKHAGKTIQEKLKTKCKLGESILLLGNSKDRGLWWATVQGVAKNWRQLND